jgi:hypothetical protein
MQIPFTGTSAAIVVLALAANAQHVVWTFTGSVGDEYGAALLQTADQNNDGYPDVIVGAPGWSSGRGYVRALSGKFLATGTGSTTLWTYYHSTTSSGARCGSSLIEVGTLTGNSATDYVAGIPGEASTGVWQGGLLLIDGSTHNSAGAIFGDPNTRLGESIASVGDQDGDGRVEIAATAPSTNGSASWVHVISGASFATTQHLSSASHSSINSNGSSAFGAVVASGFDLDHDGRFDLAIGSPDHLGHGTVHVCHAGSSLTVFGVYGGGQNGERMGASIDGTRDFDGDGTNDLVIGAPGWSSDGVHHDGRVVVVSGARLIAGPSPVELLDLRFGNTAPADNHFGACVRASADLNGDGVPDVLAGAPDYAFTFIGGSINRGAVAVFSGATGARIGFLSGANGDHLGDALLGGSADMNGDGFPDFAVAGSLSDNATVDCGTLKFSSLFPSAPTTYCTAKTNSLGCTPSISYSGTASTNPATAFSVSCASVINQVNGLLFYSHAPNATSFQGGTLCVRTPLRRSPVLSSGGSASGADCSGVFTYDFGARIHSGIDPTLVAGAEIFVQCWSRDSASSSTTSLSNALRFLINP